MKSRPAEAPAPAAQAPPARLGGRRGCAARAGPFRRRRLAGERGGACAIAPCRRRLAVQREPRGTGDAVAASASASTGSTATCSSSATPRFSRAACWRISWPRIGARWRDGALGRARRPRPPTAASSGTRRARSRPSSRNGTPRPTSWRSPSSTRLRTSLPQRICGGPRAARLLECAGRALSDRRRRPSGGGRAPRCCTVRRTPAGDSVNTRDDLKLRQRFASASSASTCPRA